MSFELKILGTGSATPVFNRHPSAQYLFFADQHMLIDCGEGTQYQLMKYRVSLNKLSYIFISHLHGDHYLGLIGLVSSMQLWGRTRELIIFGPKGLQEILITQFKYSETVILYPLKFVELNSECSEVILDKGKFTVETIILNHRIPCTGFLFKEKKAKRKLIVDKIPEEMLLSQKVILKNSQDVFDEIGNLLYRYTDYTVDSKKPLSYAYCSDTAYNENILPQINQVDLLYHEATFTNEHKLRATATFHTTAEQAGKIALLANVKKLLIGHFSSRYRFLDELHQEALAQFKNTLLAEEGKTYKVNHDE